MKRKELILGIAMALGTGVAFAQDYGAFDTWDVNNDEVIDETEFNEGFNDAGLFDTWDTDDDELLGENEFGETGIDAGYYDTWDVNNDAYLDENEVGTGIFGAYDEDEDAHWEAGEFDDAGDEGWFDV